MSETSVEVHVVIIVRATQVQGLQSGVVGGGGDKKLSCLLQIATTTLTGGQKMLYISGKEGGIVHLFRGVYSLRQCLPCIISALLKTKKKNCVHFHM